jgi:hypothetical protein
VNKEILRKKKALPNPARDVVTLRFTSDSGDQGVIEWVNELGVSMKQTSISWKGNAVGGNRQEHDEENQRDELAGELESDTEGMIAHGVEPIEALGAVVDGVEALLLAVAWIALGVALFPRKEERAAPQAIPANGSVG